MIVCVCVVHCKEVGGESSTLSESARSLHSDTLSHLHKVQVK